MPRKKCYGSEAEKQAAYRLRKKEAVVESERREADEVSPVGKLYQKITKTLSAPYNLPVPVLAEPGSTSKVPEMEYGGEAREGTPVVRGTAATSKASDSRGGQNNGAPVERFESVAGSTPAAPNLSKTDQKFEEDRPGWYIFGKERKDRDCWKCGVKFETRLEMNKFCSPKCKNEYLDTAFTKLRSQ